ncbi:MAG: phosphate transport system protein [Actinomycetota bacterium]|jgi:phosphate transport system protein
MTETRRAFHEELDAIRSDVIRLGALAGEAIEAATNALLAADLGAVERVVEDDHVLDDLTHDMEQRTCLLLAQQQPMAADLRMLVTVLRVIHELERIGDLMTKVAKATRRLYPNEIEPKMRGLIDRMRDQAAAQLRLAIEAFADRDVARAAALGDMDDVMDELQKELFQTIFSAREPDDSTLQLAVQMALVGRYFERAGDHAANVADRVLFMVTGHFSFENAAGETSGETNP